jgi:hypothetical protein
MLLIYNFLCRCDVSMPDEDTQADPLDETVDKVEPEFDGLEIQDELSILQVLDKLEDISDALLSRFDSFSFITE